MAHELTHVAQQGAAGQRALQRAVQVGEADSPAEREADQVASDVVGGQSAPAALLVDNGPVEPGQMLKSQFMEQLRAEITAAADAELGPVYSAIGCPYIDQYFARYASQPAAASEAFLKRYAPATRSARTAADMIAPVVARVREGVRRWRDTGQPPPELAAAGPTAAGAGAAPTAQAHALRAPDSRAASTPLEAAMSRRDTGGDGREMVAGEPGSPAALLARLGPGQPLDAGAGQRIGSVYGDPFSDVRVHTGPVAAGLAADHDARAFTLGHHVVFASGAYRPNTVEGDALLAHELAHVVQQRGGGDPATVQRATASSSSETADESAADQAATSAIAELYANAKPADGKVARKLKTALTGRVELRRCNNSTSTPAPPAPTAAPPLPTSGADLMAGTAPLDTTQQGNVQTTLNPAGAPGTPMTDQANFAAHMRPKLDKFIVDFHADAVARAAPSAIHLSMPQVKETGRAAKEEVDRKYGSYIVAGTPHPGTAARAPGFDITADVMDQADTVNAASGPTFDPVARVRSWLAGVMTMNGYGQSVWRTHNANFSDPVVGGLITSYAPSGSSNFNKMKTIIRQWPGEEFESIHKISIGMNRAPDPALVAAAGTNAVQRAGYWDTFQILMHEYIHAAAHGNYTAAANASGGDQRHIMIEGVNDYFREKVWADTKARIPGDAPLRTRIEGAAYAYNSAVVIDHSYYPSKADATTMASQMGAAGEANLRAAYFLGHTELLGLAGSGWSAAMRTDATKFVVPAGGLALPEIVRRTFVNETTILGANAGLTAGQTVAAATVLNVPGISYHYSVVDDTDDSIARQHGITVAGLRQANPPDTRWESPPGTKVKQTAGQKILIPRH
jgi:hypothetical protein